MTGDVSADIVFREECKSEQLASLVKELKKSCTSKDECYRKVLQFVGLSDDDTIILPRFRQLIMEYFVVDPSFMYRRLFNALDREKIGTLTPKQFVTATFILLQGTFKEYVSLAFRVYATTENSTSITKEDAVAAIVESLQLSGPRSRLTLVSNNRERAFVLAEELVELIFPKLDLNGDGLISLDEFTRACRKDPTLMECFGQFLPKNCAVVFDDSPSESDEIKLAKRPSTCRSFENIDYVSYSPSLKNMLGIGRKNTTKSTRLEPIPLVRGVKKINSVKKL
ncbi:Calsenilin [Orchesella cincta]|uniref:Calsenilin n=1 Tax=Orchesella cincta TaxID=48709 RepID=A0A1D2NEF8_ORCCI|nr:Calsenilin [Orchesella cincta]